MPVRLDNIPGPTASYKALRKIEKAKAPIRAKEAPPFRAAVWIHQGAFPGTGQKCRANGDVICSVESVDGASTLADVHRRGAPVREKRRGARSSEEIGKRA